MVEISILVVAARTVVTFHSLHRVIIYISPSESEPPTRCRMIDSLERVTVRS